MKWMGIGWDMFEGERSGKKKDGKKCRFCHSFPLHGPCIIN